MISVKGFNMKPLPNNFTDRAHAIAQRQADIEGMMKGLGQVMLLVGCIILLLFGFFWWNGQESRNELLTVDGRGASSAAEAYHIAEVKCRNLPAGPERDNWCSILRM